MIRTQDAQTEKVNQGSGSRGLLVVWCLKGGSASNQSDREKNC